MAYRKYVALLLLALAGPGCALASAASFDAPLKKQVVDLGPSPYYPAGHVRIRLSCYFYAGFMVKQYDAGEKGSEWLAILLMEKGATVNCTRAHASGERIIEGEEWSGYFKGVKGHLVFFDAADGTDGGLPFAVYDVRAGKKIFEDSAYDAGMWNKKVANSIFNRLRVSTATNERIFLRYLRVVEADCDLHTEKIPFGEETRKRLSIKSLSMPICSAYKNITTRWVSAVAYPVEVFLSPQPSMKTIAGPVKCWPVD